MIRKILSTIIVFTIIFSFCSCESEKVSNNIQIDSNTNIFKEYAEKNSSIPEVEQNQSVDIIVNNFEKPEEIDHKNTETKSTDTLICSLTVRCDLVFKNAHTLANEKLSILPQDGMIFHQENIVFYAGESVFNVLARELKKNKIHIDFVNTPMYNTVYIRGIANLYEHDAGELSGWIYVVNGNVPGYGCSDYILKNGDKIEFVYTCDLGKDID